MQTSTTATQTPVTTHQIRKVPVNQIVAGNNDRKVFDQKDLHGLAESIRTVGLLQPPTLRRLPDGRLEIVAGERRVRAMRDVLGWDTIPALIQNVDEATASQLMIVENVQRSDLDAIAEANGYRSRMDQFGLTVEEVAKWAGVDKNRVNERLALLELRDDVQHLVATKQMPLAHAALMRGLDSTRQGLAMQVFINAERPPTAAEFRKVCGDLMFEQTQDTFIDADAFLVVQEFKPGDEVKHVNVPTDPTLPEFEGGWNVGEALTKYLATLQESGDPEQLKAAAAIGTAFVGLMRSNVLAVTYGALVELGVDVEPFWAEVMAANMRKAGGPVRADGKILRPASWYPADLHRVYRETYGDPPPPCDAPVTVVDGT